MSDNQELEYYFFLQDLNKFILHHSAPTVLKDLKEYFNGSYERLAEALLADTQPKKAKLFQAWKDTERG